MANTLWVPAAKCLHHAFAGQFIRLGQTRFQRVPQRTVQLLNSVCTIRGPASCSHQFSYSTSEARKPRPNQPTQVCWVSE